MVNIFIDRIGFRPLWEVVSTIKDKNQLEKLVKIQMKIIAKFSLQYQSVGVHDNLAAARAAAATAHSQAAAAQV